MDGGQIVRRIAGLGYRRGVAAADIVAAVRAAGGAEALAVPAFKADEPGVAEAAAVLGVPVLMVARDALGGAQGRCLTRSDAAMHAVGFASVAEGCALAAAGTQAVLVVARVAVGGATCAVATPPAGPLPQGEGEGVSPLPLWEGVGGGVHP